MRDVVDELYLTQHRLSAERIVQEMRGRAREHRLHPPSASTVERRIAASSLEERRRRGDIVAPIAVAGKIPPPEVPHAILAAKCLIDDDPAAGLTLSDLARESGLSRFQVLRGFARATGMTPHAYLVQCRMNNARRLIRVGISLAMAAAASGFADQSHMTRIFVRKYGLSPGAYAHAVI